MSFSEIILRLGCTFVAWLVALGHGLILATVSRMPCGGESDPFMGLLVMAGITFVFCFLLQTGTGLPGVGGPIRWLFVPLLALAPFAAWEVVPFVMSTTVGLGPLCADLGAEGALPSWGRFWAPIQLVVLGCWFGVAVRVVSSRAASS